MKKTSDNTPQTPDLSGLSPAEMASVISDLQEQLTAKDETLQNHQDQLKQRDQAIQSRDAHIKILEEL
ncbi:hypothetical protein ACT3TA_15165, partial [Halomonas sp. AOP42-C1-46]